MFYQKYRPSKFSEVFGNENVLNTLKNALHKGNLPHAFLFYGPRGTGKTTMARLLAKALACDNFSKNNDACCECSSCISIGEGRYPDLLEIDAASNNSVDNIRDINEKIGLAPTFGKLKFYIIDEVHMLSKGAFNALLKTLEEPPKNTYFVLATTEPEKVIETIKSRCQQLQFKRASVKDVSSKLKYIAKKEGYVILSNDDKNSKKGKGFLENDLNKIAQASKGGFRDAETLLEQVIIGGIEVDEVLNTVGLDYTVRFMEAVIGKDLRLCLELINDIYSKGKNLESWNKEILFYIRQLILVKNDLKDLVELDINLYPLAENQAAQISNTFILKALKAFNNSYDLLKQAYIQTLPLEGAVLEIIGEGISSSSLPNETINLNPGGDNSNTESQPPNTKNQISKKEKPKQKQKKSEKIQTSNLKSKVLNVINLSDNSEVFSQPQELNTKTFSWGDFLQNVENEKPTLAATLRTCKHIGFESNKILVEAQYQFHKERLEISGTRDILEAVLCNMLNSKVVFSCRLSKEANKNLTDKNISYVTVKADEITFTSGKKEDDFAIPQDDENFVASPVTLKKEAKNNSGTGDALSDFGGEFEV
ncbi:DNA polymerase III, subunit gamma and tau [candidate division WWE3 bacterium CG10_big_fil_rev_8_21_14_0_10_32_10]|uniref:DNA polymerase III subunit gamma/tau n=1 Tax=candidate division WWE3 bacterium CG10_big_fil_rev_8_21_14_0_10_32_10 TaxID=1975090 RepID=A0A2H0R9G0_UNCKA|nr:MAG: DNA polymerase III, subunit gamma and tau [candidate division WWE3 bacterium CG10_big_fil_rev_8_21_14_0_10_32_10]